MSPNEIEAIVQGKHGDPFRVLGPHQNGSQWEVRAFLPQAASAWVEAQHGEMLAMDKEHAGGVFVRKFADEPGAYRLRMKLWSGDEIDAQDPYRFPPILTDFELHLHGEGTITKATARWARTLITCEGVAGVRFAVWAPNAEVVTVTGDFNEWDRSGAIPCACATAASGRFSCRASTRASVTSIPCVSQVQRDTSRTSATLTASSRRFRRRCASVVWSTVQLRLERRRVDGNRAHSRLLREAVSMYEVHLGSWLRGPHNQWLSHYRELAEKLVELRKRMGLHAYGAAARSWNIRFPDRGVIR